MRKDLVAALVVATVGSAGTIVYKKTKKKTVKDKFLNKLAKIRK